MTKRVVVFGSINLDTVMTVERIARPGETVAGSALETFPGGKGGNQALAAHRAGAPVRLIGKTGCDAAGETMLAYYRESGLSTEAIGRSPAPTGAAFIQVETGTGENSIVVVAGANADFSEADANAMAIGPGDVVVCQFETPLNAIGVLFRRARGLGARTVLNPAPAMPFDAALLASVDDLILNETELAVLSGVALAGDAGDAAIERAVNALSPDSHQSVIVTRGSRGVSAYAVGETVYVAAMPVDAIDTTGAGDCFVGAYAARRLARDRLADALAFANAAAAISVTRPGAATSMPTVDEIDARLKD